MNAKKVKNGNLMVRGVVIYDNTRKAKINAYTQKAEYNVGIKVASDDNKSLKILNDFFKMMVLSQNEINNIISLNDDGSITIFAKSLKPIQILDTKKALVIDDNYSLISDKVLVALNVVVWDYNNKQSISMYTNGVMILEQKQTLSIFDIFNNSICDSFISEINQSKIESKNGNGENIQNQIGNLEDFENIISDGDIPF